MRRPRRGPYLSGQDERMPEDTSHWSKPPAGWINYRPPPRIATARPTESLELSVSRPYGTDLYELLVLDLEQEAGEVSRHDSLEQAQRFASERTGVAGIEWTITGAERLTLRPEVGAESPLWNANGEMVPLEDFPLDATLRERLENWTETAWEQDNARVTEEAEGFRSDLARQLGSGYEVVLNDDSP